MSKRAIEREQGTIETEEKERTPGTRRHKLEDVRENLCVCDFVCDLLLCTGDSVASRQRGRQG